MKANAPEKIYMPTILAANTVKYKEEGSIEYVRADSFIEKACEYLSYHLDTSKINVNYKFEFIEKFKNYMEESKV